MNPIEEFAAFESTQFAAQYHASVPECRQKALKCIGKTPEDCGPYEEILAHFANIGGKTSCQKRCGSRLFWAF